MRTTAALLSLLVASSAAAVDSRGIIITNVMFRPEGVYVAWAADANPPYRAAIHVPRASWTRRDTPVEYVDTDATSALIPIESFAPPVFVQVYKPDDPRVCQPGARRMLRADWELYLDNEDSSRTVTVADTRVLPSFDARTSLLYPEFPGRITLDASTGPAATWLPCSATDVTFRVVRETGQVGPRKIFVTNEVTVARDPDSLFPGLRVEPRLATNGLEVAVCEAYSFRTNASQSVLIRSGYISPFGSETAWRDSTNWYADGILVPATNVPYTTYSYDLRLPGPVGRGRTVRDTEGETRE